MLSASKSSPSQWSVADLGAFFVANRSEFLMHARRLTRTKAEAEEIVQDSLVRVLLACPELESADHALSYFHRVIENLSIDLFRRQGRQPRLVVLDDAADEIEVQWSVDPDYSELVSVADDAAIIREAISLLSSAERTALVMWEFEGRSTAEIAGELGLQERSVRHTVARARSSLRRILSERIVDEERGLTALDLLSVSFRKAEKAVESSSKIALSLLLIVAAFVGLNSLPSSDLVVDESAEAVRVLDSQRDSLLSAPLRDNKTPALEDSSANLRVNSPTEKSTSRSFSAISTESNFFGLGSEGIPTGFMVSDSSGNLGVLFPGQQKLSNTETGLLLSGIVSTRSGATNVLMSQSIIIDSFGAAYVAEVSVGIRGGWQPLRLSYISSSVERLVSGDYLLVAILMVDSAVETTVKVSTGSSGIDLERAPTSIATRILLDPTKTQILAQAVFISADSQGDGA